MLRPEWVPSGEVRTASGVYEGRGSQTPWCRMTPSPSGSQASSSLGCPLSLLLPTSTALTSGMKTIISHFPIKCV